MEKAICCLSRVFQRFFSPCERGDLIFATSVGFFAKLRAKGHLHYYITHHDVLHSTFFFTPLTFGWIMGLRSVS